MNVFITEPAKEALQLICDYYRSEGYGSYATRIRKSVISKAKSLSENYNRGQQEEMLLPLNQGHRYLLVERHYKIIYLSEEKRILITDIFDTRQQPEKLLVRNK